MKKLAKSKNFLYGLLFASILIDLLMRTFFFILAVILLLQIILAYGIINGKERILKVFQHIVTLIILLTFPELFFTYQTFAYAFPNENILILLLPDFAMAILRDILIIYIYLRREFFT